MPPPRPVILILAAGASARMRGADKLLLEINGVPQILRVARAALATGCAVYVTLPPDRPQRAQALQGLPVELVTVARAAEGMGASIREGVAALPPDCPVLLLLADLPEITADDLGVVLRAQAETPEAIIRACSAAGRPGHPVCFPAAVRDDLARLSGDSGARDLLAARAAEIRAVPLPGNHAVTDLDTPEEWAAWAAARGRD
ncbi:MAG TPA: nucleotidyltransferase family protein [Paracoccaceae bacterium]